MTKEVRLPEFERKKKLKGATAYAGLRKTLRLVGLEARAATPDPDATQTP